MMKLVEQCSGTGDLIRKGELVRQVHYQISRYQGMMESGLPVPGLHKIEGSIDFDSEKDPVGLVGAELTLKLEDGRSLGVLLADDSGRILSEGHGPRHGCLCC